MNNIAFILQPNGEVDPYKIDILRARLMGPGGVGAAAGLPIPTFRPPPGADAFPRPLGFPGGPLPGLGLGPPRLPAFLARGELGPGPGAGLGLGVPPGGFPDRGAPPPYWDGPGPGPGAMGPPHGMPFDPLHRDGDHGMPPGMGRPPERDDRRGPKQFTTTKAQTPCRYFNTRIGCREGDKCPFGHFADAPPFQGHGGDGGSRAGSGPRATGPGARRVGPGGRR
jgi:hypothetical protein